MKLRKFEKSKIQVVEWNDNKNEPPEEQVILNWKSFPIVEDIESYKQFKYDDQGNVILSYRSSKLLRMHLDSIDNLTDGFGKKIVTADDLLNSEDPLLAGLVAEGRNYALKGDEDLSEGESKASE